MHVQIYLFQLHKLFACFGLAFCLLHAKVLVHPLVSMVLIVELEQNYRTK